MKRKLLSILLCLVMALSLLPTAALAEEGGAAANNGTEAHPYTLAELGAMDRAEYIKAQQSLGGTMYVTVGDYHYDKNGVLGNGERNDMPGQTPDHSKLNAYGENGYLNDEGENGKKNDGANGKNIVFVGGTITSGATGYTSIDNIGTSLLLAVPAYTNVTFEKTTFKNVMSFDYQLYTSPWSQLGELKFEGCTFNGIIVGAIAAQKLTFNGCTFTNYTNTTSANSSNPTWIRPAYGNWTKDDNKGQGDDFRSLTEINFTNNTVTSTRPVKFEYISQWDITSTVTATGNKFDIKKQDGDTAIKNVGLYLGAHTDENEFHLVVDNNTRSGDTAALYTIPEGKTSLPAGSTVKDSSGNEIELTDALKWKGKPSETDNGLTLKTAYTEAAVAGINGVSYNSLTAAINAAGNGDTVTLLKDVTNGDGVKVPSGKNFTLDFANHTYTVTQNLAGSTGTESQCFQLLKDSTLTFKNGTIKANNGNVAMIIQNYSNLTLENMLLDGESITRNDVPIYTMSNNCGNVVIKDTTINTVSNGFAFDVYGGFGDYSDVTVTVTGSSEINGKIEVARVSGTQNKNKNTLAINGGTINGALVFTDHDNTIITISGGNFSQSVDKKYLHPSLTAELKRASGKTPYSYYTSVAAATAAAQPGDTVTDLNATTEQTVTLTLKYNDGATADTTYNVASGTTITLPTPAYRSGYTFNGWYDGSKFYAAGASYTVSATVTLNAFWSYISSGSSSYVPTYSVSTPSKTENGSVTVSPKNASKGDTVTVTVKPDSGYVLETLTVTDKNGNELTLKYKGNGKYTFTMPAGKVEVKATFMEDNSMLNFFYDVPNGAYFYEAVKWAVKNGITTGVGNYLFAPEQPCTRAQIVTFLWRAAGSPEPKGAASGMTDVVSGSYYEKAVAWAIENGITTGTTTSTFSPDATCTRAQAVTFLARALNAKATSVAEFSDVPTNSYFADAVAWAAANGVTEGIGGGLFGSDNDCTRGQIVTFLYRAYNK